MSLINPFRAVIPVPDKAALVVTRDLQSYSPEELDAILNFNPYSFLHVLNPGVRFEKQVTGQDRFLLVRNRYLEFLQEGIFEQDPAPALYVYELETESFTCYGLLGNLDLEHYRSKRVKPHEKTLKARTKVFKDYLQTTRIQTDPVLLVHNDHKDLQQLISELQKSEPDLNFTSTDRSNHRLWRISSSTTVETITKYLEEIPNIYIADGHHRISSSSGLYGLENDNKAASFVMSLFIAASQVKISGFTRLVKDLNGLTPTEFLMALDRYFIIEKHQTQHLAPEHSTAFTMYLDGQYYKLLLRNEYLLEHPLKDLPPSILQRTVLKPLLGIKSMRRSNRIVYDHCANGELRMKEDIDKGLYRVGFTHYPVSFEQLKAVADNGLKMPPKSTYIEPKLKSALTLYEF